MGTKRMTGNNDQKRAGNGQAGRLFSAVCCLTLVALFVLSGCSMPLREGYVETALSTLDRYVLDYDLQKYVPVPALGATAVTSLERRDMIVTVQWKNALGEDIPPPNPFLDGVVYRSQITMEGKDPYFFDEELPFAYLTTVADVEGDDGGPYIRTLDVSYYPFGTLHGVGEDGVVTDYDLQHYVPIPAAGAPVVKNLAHAAMMVQVLWMDESGNPLDDDFNAFEVGMVYQAEITLTARDIYSFNPDIPFDYLSAEIDGPVEGENTDPVSRTLTVRYLAAKEFNIISVIDLTHHIHEPVMGEMPVKAFTSGDSFTGTVEWRIGMLPVTDEVFRPSADYTAEVTLKPVSPNVFAPDVLIVYDRPGLVGIFTLSETGELSGIITFGLTEAPPVSRFSGRASGAADSAIDLIRTASGQDYLYIQMIPETETVELSDAVDLSAAGLVLTYNGENAGNGENTGNGENAGNGEDGGNVESVRNVRNGGMSNSPAHVVLDGGYKTVDLIGSPTGSPIITVGAGVTLTLRNITFKGLRADRDDAADNNAPLIVVTEGGKLILEDDAVIAENKYEDSRASGGGVSVLGGVFIMNGGTIRDNSAMGSDLGSGGGGVYVGSAKKSVVKGDFTMNGGTIEENEAGAGGGVFVWEGSLFTLNDGIIRKNKTMLIAVVTAGAGGGVRTGGQFIMNGGIISENTAVTTGGGVSLFNPTALFIMNYGTIGENTAAGGGGGVSITNGGGQFSMNYGSISGNEAPNGGGVYAESGSFIMNYGVINGNEVTDKDGNGGGVYVGQSGPEAALFSMRLGFIQSNSIYSGGPDNGTGKGCGVYVASRATFNKVGGTIYGIANNNFLGDKGRYEWEANELQNYYDGPAHNDDSYGHPTIDKTPGGRDRGYAVYYDRIDGGGELTSTTRPPDGSGDWRREKTLGPNDNLDTDIRLGARVPVVATRAEAVLDTDNKKQIVGVRDERNKGDEEAYKVDYEVEDGSGIVKDKNGNPLYVVQDRVIYLADENGTILQGYQNYADSKWYDDYGEDLQGSPPPYNPDGDNGGQGGDNSGGEGQE